MSAPSRLQEDQALSFSQQSAAKKADPTVAYAGAYRYPTAVETHSFKEKSNVFAPPQTYHAHIHLLLETSAGGNQEKGVQRRVRLSHLHVPASHRLSRAAVLRHRRRAQGGQAPVRVLDKTRRRLVAVHRRLDNLPRQAPRISLSLCILGVLWVVQVMFVLTCGTRLFVVGNSVFELSAARLL